MKHKSSEYKSSRSERKAQALIINDKAQHLLNTGQISPAQLFQVPKQLKKLKQSQHPHHYQIVSQYSQVAAQDIKKTAGVLVFASSSRPGGGWRNGACAQEEDICLASTWGVQATAASDSGFYNPSTKLGALGPDAGLIADGLWLYDRWGQELEVPAPASFIAISAPNLRNGACKGIPKDKLIDHLALRLAGALEQWGKQGITDVVMGAIGCGVFCWEPEQSAKALRLALDHYRATGLPHLNLVLAMPDYELAQKFSKVLSDEPTTPSVASKQQSKTKP